MAVDAAHGFPWTSNPPTTRQRVFFALALSLAAFGIVVLSALDGSARTDFSLTWFGGSALLHGANPYALVGPGKVFDSEWPALYPATTYVIGMPFALLPEYLASAVFVGVSTFALAYGSTRDSWHRVPLFASVAFLSSAKLGQWSVLFTAALFIPSLSIVFPAKPQLAIPVLAGDFSRKRIMIAGASAVALLGVSLAMIPSWPADWVALLPEAQQLTSPLLVPGGFAVLAALIRWRRPEAWLVALLVAMPQTSYPYNLLPLLAIGATYRESCILSVSSSIGAFISVYLTDAVGTPAALDLARSAMLAFGYLPASLIVLSRPNAPVGRRAGQFPYLHFRQSRA